MRAFIAVDLSPLPALESVLKELNEIKGVKAVEPSTLHITLKFLGDTEERLSPTISDIMREAVYEIEPFEVEISGGGAFPEKGPARVIWAGIQGGNSLQIIARRLEEKCAALGFPREDRGFKAHLTLARIKDPRASKQAREVVEKISCSHFGKKKVEEIVLKKSVLRPQGPDYFDVLKVRFS
ncbi:MAG: RNA 2',3'-cyclic phosphodiesterase [Methanomassiliicoccales archaeon]